MARTSVAADWSSDAFIKSAELQVQKIIIITKRNPNQDFEFDQGSTVSTIFEAYLKKESEKNLILGRNQISFFK